MLSIVSYLVLALFLGGSLYILGLMFYLVLQKKGGNVKSLTPKGSKHPKLPEAA